jgi:hypothetical protein
MPTPQLSDELALQALQAKALHANESAAAAALGIPRGTLQNRVRVAISRGLQPGVDIPHLREQPAPDAVQALEIQALRKRLREVEGGETLQTWAKQLIQAANEKAIDRPPAPWLSQHVATPSAAGIPTLFLSDLHWGELVRESEVGGINAYGLSIAQQRLETVISKTCSLLRDHVVGDYPGIVLALGGDMVSGSIHDELLQTNEGTVMQQMLDLFEHLQTAITRLADEFGHVHLPCVTGNHGRSNKKWQAKQRAHLSYEWLMYQFLQRTFASDDRISFQIPEGPDADYALLGTGYRLTHGDTFRGGDGIIGPIGPVTRGTLKRGRMAGAMGAPFDQLILGHWHTLTWGSNFIINGSLKGFDEFAMSLSITPEAPAQALWLTTEKHGRTIQLPVYA